MGKCMFLRKGSKHEAPSVKFADSTWEQIIEACQANKVPESWAVGDQKAMAINGVDYLVDIIGKNHDDYADGSGKAPLTFMFHQMYRSEKGNHQKFPMNNSNHNSGGWTSCQMRTTELPAFLALLPSEVQAGIREVNKLTSAGYQSTTINTTADKLFFLSEVEVANSTSYSYAGEGTQYAYFAAGNSFKRVWHSSPQSSASYWLRSPTTKRTSFCAINNAGSVVGYDAAAEGVVYICPAFCF